MTPKPETLCTGCGATVNFIADGSLRGGDWKDVTGSAFCPDNSPNGGDEHFVKTSVELPPDLEFKKGNSFIRIGCSGNVVNGIVNNEFIGGLLLANQQQWNQIKAELESKVEAVQVMNPTIVLSPVEIREEKKRTYWDYELQMSVLKCRSCGALALALEDESGGQRITGHKCSGAWETLQTFKDVKFDLVDLDIYNKIGKSEAL